MNFIRFEFTPDNPMHLSYRNDGLLTCFMHPLLSGKHCFLWRYVACWCKWPFTIPLCRYIVIYCRKSQFEWLNEWSYETNQQASLKFYDIAVFFTFELLSTLSFDVSWRRDSSNMLIEYLMRVLPFLIIHSFSSFLFCVS